MFRRVYLFVTKYARCCSKHYKHWLTNKNSKNVLWKTRFNLKKHKSESCYFGKIFIHHILNNIVEVDKLRDGFENFLCVYRKKAVQKLKKNTNNPKGRPIKLLFLQHEITFQIKTNIQKIFLHVNKKNFLRTKENVPYRTVPVETFRSGYWPLRFINGKRAMN